MYNFLIYIFVHDCCRVPHGTRGLKSRRAHADKWVLSRRVPHGTRGLKSVVLALEAGAF